MTNRLTWPLERWRLRNRIADLDEQVEEWHGKCRAQDVANAELRAELLAAEAQIEILLAGDGRG